jgi:oligosaccharide 4-alpha-D-glucosyltransferase
MMEISFLVVCYIIFIMKKLLWLLLFISNTAFSIAQEALESVKGLKGKFSVQQYDANIYKIIFQPEDYQKNELLSDAVILKPIRPSNASVKVIGDSVFINGRLIISGTHRDKDHHGFYFPLLQGEKIYGGGERAISLNRRGHRFNFYNNPWYGYGEGADNLNYSVPFLTSSEGYGLYFDNPSRGYVDIGKQEGAQLEFGAVSGELNVYVIFGDQRSVLSSFHKLTGKQPLPPRWAMGNLMSRFGYTSESQVNEIYNKMRSENIPVDAIIYDLFWFGDSIKGTLGNLEWVNKQKWPDPARMIRGYKEKGVQTILVTEPFFVETSLNYTASRPFLAVDSNRNPYFLKDFYFGQGGLIDIFRNDARQWFWSFYKKQMDLGVEAWWGDLGEPEKHPADLYHQLKDLGHNRLFSADEVHNIYGHHWTKMLYKNYETYYPRKRLFSLNRSGFAGTQRYSIFPWTGDVSRSWGGFRSQLPVLLGMSMSGIPYVHSDAGGFAGGEGDQELYLRWLQFAAFTPILRPHGTALYEVEPAAFSFPSEAALLEAPFRQAAGEAIRLRYQFLPYNYTLAYQQARWGKPLMAPLYYHFPGDTTATSIEDQYMWGDQLMVVPVIEKGANTRKYYLPGSDWHHFFSGKTLKGNAWHTDTVSLEHFPLLVKEGSFLPMSYAKKIISNTQDYTSDSLLVLYVPSGKSSSFDLYHDDGHSKDALEAGNYELIRFSASARKGNISSLTVRAANPGKFPVSRRKVFLYIATADKKIRKIMVNGREKTNTFPLDVSRSGAGGLVIPLDYSIKPVNIQIIWN